MRNWLRIVLFVSSFSPVLVSLGWVHYEISGWSIEVTQFIVSGILGTSLPILVIHLLAKQGEMITINVKKVESNDFMLVAFSVSYLIPFFIRGAALTFNAIALIMLAIAFLLYFINSLPAHPLLQIFRFKFYRIESSSGMVYTLISRRKILDPKEIVAVKKISESMLMESNNV